MFFMLKALIGWEGQKWQTEKDRQMEEQGYSDTVGQPDRPVHLQHGNCQNFTKIHSKIKFYRCS